ncbi:TraY domain-containing protein [Rhizobium sp. 2YAF20]|uniref:type II toxin-antitoxin system RelB family antitoxin n=1 Tax=Rhizobium sp. 2YAF20 TaxID=3233027 RepID=UPI003F9B6822
MSKHIAIRLPDETYGRLQALAERTGRTATLLYIRQAIETHLEDLGDIYLTQAAMERIRSGESKIISGEEFWRGMDD